MKNRNIALVVLAVVASGAAVPLVLSLGRPAITDGVPLDSISQSNKLMADLKKGQNVKIRMFNVRSFSTPSFTSLDFSLRSVMEFMFGASHTVPVFTSHMTLLPNDVTKCQPSTRGGACAVV